MSKNNHSAETDHLSVTADRPSKGDLGSGPVGKGDGGDRNIISLSDPNASFSYTTSTIEGLEGLNFTVTVHGARIINPQNGHTTNNIEVDGKGNSVDYKKNNVQNNQLELPIPYNNKLARDRDLGRLTSRIRKDYFDLKNNKARVSIYNGHYIHTVTFDDAGNVQNISEEYIEKTYNRYSKGIPNEKKDRLEEVKRFAILGYKTEPSNILDYNVKIKEYEFIFTLNKLGFIEKFSKKIIKASQYESRQLNAFYKDLNIEQDEKKENLAKLMVVNAYQSYPQNKKFIQDAEKEALMGAADIITNTGEKISKHLGEKYKTIANEIASDLRNFQGKKLRSLSDALKMMEKINRNPNIKIKQADRVVLANAVRHVDTKILSENFQRLGKSFGVLGKVLSVEKLREKAAIGCETGNWKPLMLEVEAMIISGYATGIAISIAISFISSIASFLAIGALPTTLAIIATIMLISYLASLIDDKVVDKINNLLIPEAH